MRIPLLAHIRRADRVGSKAPETVDVLLLLHDLAWPDSYTDDAEVEKDTNSCLQEAYNIVEEINYIHKIKVGAKLACSKN